MNLLILFKRLLHRSELKNLRQQLKHCGSNVYVDGQFTIVGRENISLGDSVYIGPNATLLSTKAALTIKGHFMAGPNLTIVTGDHRIDIKDRYMDSITSAEKLPENDIEVVIEEDVWCGANVTILKGVHIHKGSVIGAGAVVTKDIGEYEIWAGVPARKIKNRFDE